MTALLHAYGLGKRYRHREALTDCTGRHRTLRVVETPALTGVRPGPCR